MKKMACIIAAAVNSAFAAESSLPAAAFEKHDPAFQEYKAFEDVTVEGWQYANDEVGRLRGHMGHLNHGIPSPPRPDSSPAGSKQDSGSRR